MHQKYRRAAGILAVVVLLLLMLPPASIVATSWCSRWRAQQLLACAREFHPGITSEAQALKTLSPFNRYISHGEESYAGHASVRRDSYLISNYPKWPERIAQHLPDWVNRHIWFLPWTDFSVSPRFERNQLVLLSIAEAQENRGNAHPYVANVTILSTQTEHDLPETPDNFTGFHTAAYEQGEFDGDGKQIGPTWIIREYVTLDERATPAEFNQSLAFRFACLTSLFGCRDARRLLPIGQREEIEHHPSF